MNNTRRSNRDQDKKKFKSTSLGHTDDHFLIKMKMYC